MDINIHRKHSKTSQQIGHSLITLGSSLDTILQSENVIYDLVKHAVLGLSSADAGVIYLYDKNHNLLRTEAAYGYPNRIQCSLTPKEGVVGICYTERKSQIYTSEEYLQIQSETHKQTSINCLKEMRKGLPDTISIIASPLIFKNKVFGTILMEHYEPDHSTFTKSDLYGLESLSNWFSLIIDYIRSYLLLKENKHSYRQLLKKIIYSNEEERKNVTREIHDEINQILLSARLTLEEIEQTPFTEINEIIEKVRFVRLNINRVFDALHRISMSLRPPVIDTFGLPEAIEDYIKAISSETGLPISLSVKGLKNRRPAFVIEMELYRITQEAICNVVKHASATSANIELIFDASQLILIIEDNGKGFYPHFKSNSHDSIKNIGLIGMRERAEICGGVLEIISAPGRGTKIKVEIPISAYDWGVY
jgi:signal transduction histidine kinase